MENACNKTFRRLMGNPMQVSMLLMYDIACKFSKPGKLKLNAFEKKISVVKA